MKAKVTEAGNYDPELRKDELIEQLQETVGELSRGHKRLYDEAQELRAQANKLRTENVRLEEDERELTHELQLVRDQSEDAKACIKQVLKERHELSAATQDLQARLKVAIDARGRSGELQAEVERLKAEVERLKAEVERLKAEAAETDKMGRAVARALMHQIHVTKELVGMELVDG